MTQRTISRDHKPRDIMNETSNVLSYDENHSLLPENNLVSRRDVLTGLLPALGKGLGEILRGISVRVGETLDTLQKK